MGFVLDRTNLQTLRNMHTLFLHSAKSFDSKSVPSSHFAVGAMARAVWMAVATLALAHVAYGTSIWSGSVDCPAGQVVSDVVGEFGGGGVAGCNAVSVTPVLTRLCSGRCAVRCSVVWCLTCTASRASVSRARDV